MKRVALWAAVGGYLATIFYLSSLPNPLPALTSSVNDKILHGIEYGGLAVLIALALRASGFTLRTTCVLAIVLASVYGASDEAHQFFVPSRESDVFDWLADTGGGAVAVAGFGVLARRRQRAQVSS